MNHKLTRDEARRLGMPSWEGVSVSIIPSANKKPHHLAGFSYVNVYYAGACLQKDFRLEKTK